MVVFSDAREKSKGIESRVWYEMDHVFFVSQSGESRNRARYTVVRLCVGIRHDRRDGVKVCLFARYRQMTESFSSIHQK